jgi:ankyrin repeat protein
MDDTVSLFLTIQLRDEIKLQAMLSESPEWANAWRHDPLATPLHACVFNPGMAEILLKQGANPCGIDDDERMLTPLHLCAAAGDAKTLKLLTAAAEDVNVRSKWGTPLHLALGNGECQVPETYLDVVKVLVEAGADVNAPVAVESDQWTPLHQACNEELADAVEYLIANGSKVFIGKDGLTPMMVAKSMGAADVIEILERHGAK